MNNIDILEEFIKTYNEVVTEEQEVIVNKKYLSEKIQAIESLIAEYKELKEEKETDYTSVYLKGVYDEREKWQKKIKDIINRLEYDISKTREIKTTRYSDYDRIRLKAYVTKSKEMIERLQSLLGKE